jgi:ABC-type phosphate transport system substrate-binding protein
MRIAILFAASLALLGCKKKDDKPAEGPAAATAPTGSAAPAATPTEAAKPAEGTLAAAGSTTPAVAPPTAAELAAAEIKTEADYEAKGLTLIEKIGTALESAKLDCNTAAANLNKVLDENNATIGAINAFETAHPEAEQNMGKKHGDKIEALQEKVTPVMEGCKHHQGLKSAFGRLE